MYKYKEKFDIRILQLGKWQIPKPQKFNANEQNMYLSMGYFDLIDVKCAKDDYNSHPFLRAYETFPRHTANSNKKQKKLMEEYTMQELMIFTNIEEEGILREDNISEFWKRTSLVLCVSLIHIDNDSDIDAILKQIECIFAGKAYLYYFSFDYSGIVLLVKENSINNFTELMFKLNFNVANECKLIRDSYSFYGFNNVELGKVFTKIGEAISKEVEHTGKEPCYEKIAKLIHQNCGDKCENIFSATVNIGIQNYSAYTKLRKEIEKTGAKLFGLLGRHDISVVKEQADLEWLIYIHYLLDKYTISDSKEFKHYNFTMHETFVKVADEWNLKGGDVSNSISNTYENAKKLLGKYCDDFVKKVEEKEDWYNGQYSHPVRAVQYSILSILRNGFAEDFVLCMYKPFISFLDYLMGKIDSGIDDPACFDECYNKFFICINSLVNSAMHSERQFIQATAFNAIIYDVPAKIMAFYMAIIDDIQNLMRTKGEEEIYTFLLTPSFSNEISVRTISYENEPKMPHGRLLRVAINERSLYDPPSVIRRMAHEVAHYAGDKLRNRKIRKKYVEKSLLHILLTQVLHNSLIGIGGFGDELLKSILEILMMRDCFAHEKYNYSSNLCHLPALIIYEMLNNDLIYEEMLKYIEKTLERYFNKNLSEKDDELEKYISDITMKYVGNKINLIPDDGSIKEKLYIVSRWIMEDSYEELEYINNAENLLLLNCKFSQSIISEQKDKPLKSCTLAECMKGILSMYSEAYADIQMILLTNIFYEDYLTSFIRKESIELADFLNNISDIGRVTTVSMMMYCFGIWEDVENEKIAEDKDICQLHITIRKGIHDMISIMTDDQKKRYFEDQKSVGHIFLENIEAVKTRNLSSNRAFDECHFAVGKGIREDKVKAYINLYLAEYLGKCIIDTISEYEKGKVAKIEKTKMITQLQSKIETVNGCKNIKHVFEEICKENYNYREALFNVTSE